MRVIHYARVSTKEQARNGESIDSQTRRLEGRSISEEYTVVAVITDEGRSAKDLNRPGIQQALEMLRKGEADALMVSKLDRLTRSVRDLCHLTEEYFGKADGPQLISLTESIDTTTASGRLVMNVMISVAQWQRENTGENVRDQIADRRSAGLRYCRSIYGTDHVEFAVGEDRTDAKIVKNESEQKVINYMRQLRREGQSYSKIAKKLNSGFIPAPRGSKWYAMTVKRILDNVSQAA